MRITWKLRAILCAVVLLATVQPASAPAAVTFGSSLVKPPDTLCSNCAAVTLNSIAGIEQTGSPVNGTLISARVRTRVEPGDGIFRILRPAGGPLEFLNVGQAPVSVTADGSPIGHVTEVATNLPIAMGDRLAVAFPGQDMHFLASGAAALCAFHPEPPLQEVGAAVTYTTSPCGAFEVLVSGTVEPDNSFTLGKPKPLKKGRAKLSVTVPNAGVVVATAAGSAAVTAKRRKSLIKPVTVTAASKGTVVLRLRPTRAGRKPLARGRRLKVPVSVTFTPTGGAAKSRNVSVALRKSASYS